MQAQLIEALQKYWMQLIDMLPKILIAIAAFIVTLFIARQIKHVVERRALKRLEDPLLAKFLAKVTNWILIIIGITIALHIIGLSKVAGSILAGAGVSAIVFGFAFRDIGENFLAGIMLAFNRPFKIGDTVEMDNIKGTIKELDLRCTHVHSFDGKDIYVPNAMILKNPLYNYTSDGLLRFDFVISVALEDDIEKAQQLIFDSISKEHGVLADPAPFITINDIDKHRLSFQAFYWVNVAEYKGSIVELKNNILNRSKKILIESGFTLPSDIVELKIYREKFPFPIELINLSGKQR